MTTEADASQMLPPETNLTCLIGKFETMLDVADTTFGASGNISAILGQETLSGCQMVSPPYFPDDPAVWFKTLFVAFLGSMQQFALIGN